MSDQPHNNDPNDTCFYCSHIYSVHFINDTNSFERNEISDTHTGCNYITSGKSCICPGFRSSNKSQS
jgi:hypothetical protein